MKIKIWNKIGNLILKDFTSQIQKENKIGWNTNVDIS